MPRFPYPIRFARLITPSELKQLTLAETGLMGFTAGDITIREFADHYRLDAGPSRRWRIQLPPVSSQAAPAHALPTPSAAALKPLVKAVMTGKSPKPAAKRKAA
jgi:hypothetical protein